MIVDIKQGSENPEWLEFRSKGIGGSDVSCLLGSSFVKYKNPFTLFKSKMGLSLPFEVNEAMQFGIDQEDSARNKIIELSGTNFTPMCAIDDEYDFLRVSLDGISDDGKEILELKCPQEKAFDVAKSGKIFSAYYSQIQLAFRATKAEIATYGVYSPTKGMCRFEVDRCEEYIEEIVKRSKKFWNEFYLPQIPCLSSDFGIDDSKTFDEFKCEGMTYRFVGFYPNATEDYF